MRQTVIRNFDLKPHERPRRRWKDDVKTDIRNRVSAWCVLRRVITQWFCEWRQHNSANGDTMCSAKGDNTMCSAKGDNNVFCEW